MKLIVYLLSKFRRREIAQLTPRQRFIVLAVRRVK